jgi:hypothetical protein
MRRVQISLKEAENDTNHTFAVDTKTFWKPVAPPADIRRVDYGVDRDVLQTKANLEESEGELGHKMAATFTKPAEPKLYQVPNFGVDADIKRTGVSLKQAEKDVGHNLEATFHPAAAIPKMNYKVPSFGPDKQIEDTKKSLATAEKMTGHNWELVQLQSDPICSSAGCTQYKQKSTPLGYDLDYFVPDFGVDSDILDTTHSILNAELTHHRKLIMGTKESKQRYKNMAKQVDYNFKPELSDDIKDSQSNLKNAEKSLGEWTIEEEPSYNPYYWQKDGEKA